MGNNLPEVIYEPRKKGFAFWHEVIATTKGLVLSHELAYQLTKRDISASYRQSILGIFWAFLVPIATTGVWLLLNGAGVVNVEPDTIPYSAYLLSGTMVWAIFSESINAPLEKTVLNKAILTKVNFAREGLILSGIYHSVFNGIIKIIILIPALWLLGVGFNYQLVLVPFGLLVVVICGTAIGMIITPLGLLYSDISKALPLILQFLMYSVPVVYLIPETGLFSKIVNLNPLTPLIVQMRDWTTCQSNSLIVEFFITAVVGFFILILGLLAFRVALPKLIERIGS